MKICAAGISAGIDMSLHVVARLLGEEVARDTAERMEYRWQPEDVGTQGELSERSTSIKDLYG